VSARFTHFAGIDWSGAKGTAHKGIAVAMIGLGDGAPALVRPGHVWSRLEVLDWIVTQAPRDTLIGFDMGQSLAFADAGAFFPGWDESPPHARALWAMVEDICVDEPDLGVSTFVDHPCIAPYFRRHGGRLGAHFGSGNSAGRNSAGRGRWRVAEENQARVGLRPTSNFNLVGAAQVGKASLAGMRLLHRLPRDVAVWPMDQVPARGKVVVEIYSAIAAIAGGRRAGASKIHDGPALDAALVRLGAGPLRIIGPVSEHAADALMIAAWLRQAGGNTSLWHPAAMSDAIARTEGWTFGVD